MPKQTPPQPRPKALYRVKNWSDYDKALVQRGSLTFWMSDDFETKWRHTGEKQRGSQFEYSEQAIRVMLTVKEVFHLTNRGVEGCVRSLFWLMTIPLPVPDHTTLSKRGQTVKVNLPKKAKSNLTIVMDSTGLKIYGAGEWLQEKHKVRARRTWRKLHLAIDANTGMIVASTLTETDAGDPSQVGPLLDQTEGEIASVTADGAYDGAPTYATIAARGEQIKVIIPPRADAILSGQADDSASQRDRHIATIAVKGRLGWQEESGYGRRSLVETTMGRYKAIIGPQLRARGLAGQCTEAAIGVAVLNRMLHAGRPKSVRSEQKNS